MSKKNMYIYITAVLVFTILGFSYGYLNTLFSFQKPQSYMKSGTDEGKVVTQSPQIVTSPHTMIKYITRYSGCDHTVSSEELLDPSLIGFTKDEYMGLVDDWSVTGFSPEEIILERKIVGVCDEHYYVGVHNGCVTLFRGAPDFDSTIIEQTEIPVDKLRGEDRALLEKGLVIVDKEEYLTIREGFAH